MMLHEISYAKHYADFNNKKKDVGSHPSIIFEDEYNYYVIHLTSNKDFIESQCEDAFPFLCKNTIVSDVKLENYICYISLKIANISKKSILNLKENKRFLIQTKFQISNKKELLEKIHFLFTENKFEFYNAYFNRKATFISRDLSNEINLMLKCLDKKIKEED